MACNVYDCELNKITERILNGEPLLKEITHVIDCECFTLGKKHFYREISIFDMKEKSVNSYQCFMENFPGFFYLNEKERKVINYQYRIHGLKFYNTRKKGFFSQYEMIKLLEKKYGGRSDVCFGYKGGNIESKLCEEIQINCMNLEHFGIEKYVDLLRVYKLPSLCCFNHSLVNVHCSKYEVMLFAGRIFEKIDRIEDLFGILEQNYEFKKSDIKEYT